MVAFVKLHVFITIGKLAHKTPSIINKINNFNIFKFRVHTFIYNLYSFPSCYKTFGPITCKSSGCILPENVVFLFYRYMFRN